MQYLPVYCFEKSPYHEKRRYFSHQTDLQGVWQMVRGGRMNEKNMKQNNSSVLPSATTADSIALIDPASIDVTLLLRRHEMLMELSAVASETVSYTHLTLPTKA